MLTERDITDRHTQALGEAWRAAQALGRNADPSYMAPRGGYYWDLRGALLNLEGSSRQMAHFRADARWVKLGIFYARILRQGQVKFVGQKWAWFAALKQVFELGERSMRDLETRKTGARGPVLPTQPTDWIIMPDLRIPSSDHRRLH